MATQAVEPDGNKVRWNAGVCAGDLTLTGSYASLRPVYLRRSSALSREEWKRSLVQQYRRLVIQNQPTSDLPVHAPYVLESSRELRTLHQQHLLFCGVPTNSI